MKKIIIIISSLIVIIALITVFLLVDFKNEHDTDKLLVYTSFYPLYDFTKKIGGDKIQVMNLINVGEEAHHYEPTPKDMANLYKADLIIINGLDMEHWIEELDGLTSKIVDTSVGIETIQKPDNSTDKHIWLNIQNAIKQMENIKNALTVLDVNNSQYYQNNFDKYALLFNLLDQAYIDEVSAFTCTSLIVSHGAFEYLAKRYNLEQIPLEGLDEESEPNAATMAHIIDYINENNISVVFYHDEINPEVAARVASETNAKIDVLYTLENLTLTQKNAGEDYLSLMSHNLLTLKKALA